MNDLRILVKTLQKYWLLLKTGSFHRLTHNGVIGLPTTVYEQLHHVLEISRYLAVSNGPKQDYD